MSFDISIGSILESLTLFLMCFPILQPAKLHISLLVATLQTDVEISAAGDALRAAVANLRCVCEYVGGRFVAVH